MVIERRGTTVFYPSACQSMLEIQEKIQQILLEEGINGRWMFPITSPLSLYEDNYNDIYKEYLVDFNNSEDDVRVFNPEYYTVIKDYNERYMNTMKDQKFYYIQQTLSYTSVERRIVKEDSVIGFCFLNNSYQDGWLKFGNLFSKIAAELGGNKYVTEFSNNNTITAKIDGIIVGSAKKNILGDIMEGHFSITDLYTVLAKLKKV